MKKTMLQQIYEETGIRLGPIEVARDRRLNELYRDYVDKKPGAYERFRDFIRNEYVARGLQWERQGWSADFLEKYAVEVERNMDSGGVTFVRWDDGSTSHITEEGLLKQESWYKHRVPWRKS